MASTYLQRTESAGNRRTFTWSAWIKRSKINTSQFLAACSHSSSDEDYFFFNGSNILVWQASTSAHGDLQTTKVFRDTNAWYNIILAVDTTQATAANRMKLYVNGVQETAFGTANYPNQDTQLYWNVGGSYYPRIGRRHASSDYFDGVMSHVAHIDGTQELPTIFGETDSTTGEWKIKPDITPSSGWGTNGYHILKDGNSVTDQSGQGNNWAVQGGTLTKTEDSPSNIFCTLNPLANFYSNHGLTNGNTRTSSATASSYQSPIYSTLGAASGKFYAECKVIQTSTAYSKIGIGATQITGTNQGFGSLSNQYVYNGETGAITGQSSGATYTDGDIIGIAFDLDNNKLYFHKNGTYQNSGDPTSGSTGTGASSITAASSTGLGFYFLGCGDIASNSPQAIWEWNFGNGYFGTTAVSSAGTNASGNGIFEYDVPSGYTALSTKGLNS